MWHIPQDIVVKGMSHKSAYSHNTLRIIQKTERVSPLTLVLREFLLDRQARNVAPGTLRFYRQKLTPLIDYLTGIGITQANDVQPTHLRHFLVMLQNTGHTSGGQHAYFRAMRAFFRWLEFENEIESNPITYLSSPKVSEELLEPAPLDHIRKMLSVCDRKTEIGCRDRAIIMTLLDTGMRASEMTALNVSDVDLATGSVLIRSGKGRKPRMVFLGAKSLRALIRYLRFRSELDEHQPLWLTRNGRRLGYFGLRDVIRRRAKDAGVPAPSLHAFRRSFALFSLRSGVDIYTLQRLLGHTSLQVLRRYLKQTTDDLREAHRKHGPVDTML